MQAPALHLGYHDETHYSSLRKLDENLEVKILVFRWKFSLIDLSGRYPGC